MLHDIPLAIGDFKVLKAPQQLTWKQLIQVIDLVGIWHYSRSIPNKKDYDIQYTSQQTMIITCPRTRTRITINGKWQAMFTYIGADGKGNMKSTVEGQIYSALPYVSLLLRLKAIEYDRRNTKRKGA